MLHPELYVMCAAKEKGTLYHPGSPGNGVPSYPQGPECGCFPWWSLLATGKSLMWLSHYLRTSTLTSSSFYLEANQIFEANQKCAVLLTVIGSKASDIAFSLVDLHATKKNNFALTPSETDVFISISAICCQTKGLQLLYVYNSWVVVCLQAVILVTSLDALLRDWLMYGVWDEALQRRFLTKQNLTFVTGQEEALVHKAVAFYSKEIRVSFMKIMPTEIAIQSVFTKITTGSQENILSVSRKLL